MPATRTKDKVLDVVRQLPPDASVEDAMERLYFLSKVLRGLDQAEQGHGIPHAEATRRLAGD